MTPASTGHSRARTGWRCRTRSGRSRRGAWSADRPSALDVRRAPDLAGRPARSANVAAAAGGSLSDRAAAFASFRVGAGWHCGTDVDQLSAQEARVIADRLLRRLRARTPAARRKVAAVEPALTEAIRRRLGGARMSAQACEDALPATARPHLETSELAALKTAIERGFTPTGHERQR